MRRSEPGFEKLRKKAMKDIRKAAWPAGKGRKVIHSISEHAIGADWDDFTALEAVWFTHEIVKVDQGYWITCYGLRFLLETNVGGSK